MRRPFSGSALIVFVAVPFAHADANLRVEPQKAGGIAIVRPTVEKPIFVFNAPEDGRPYVHPMLAPDGKGRLTEFEQSSQTGIYFGLVKANGLSYFGHRDANHFRRRSFDFTNDSQGVRWISRYELLNAEKNAQLTETQAWHFRDFTKTYLIDLTLTLKAETNVAFAKSAYGGLFVNTPWKNHKGAKAVNSEGQENAKADRQKARWVDTGMTVDGRKDAAHIAVLSPAPVFWRVDSQYGVGHAPSGVGAWKLAKGESATFRYRFLVYTGDFQADQVEAEWKAFASIK